MSKKSRKYRIQPNDCPNECATDPMGAKWHYPPCLKSKGKQDGTVELRTKQSYA